ncbi:uncharacterized protein [Nicotiana tomentosiformis]|uniref:uncharacterized protein n=1 Tax=Nicotiana tomentosiformis TaxID=4098 RepID=UPI00388CD7EB
MLFLVGRRRFASDAAITGMVPVCHRDASVLFDSGSTYLYVSSYFAPYLDISRNSLSAPIYVSMPVGDSIVVDRVYRSFLVVIGGYETRVDLFLLSMVDFDVILGMDWLSPYHASRLSCQDCDTGYARIFAVGMEGYIVNIPSKVVSFLKAHRMVEKGCEVYLAFVRDVSVDTLKVESVPVVRDFPDVFLADHQGMLPDRDIDFGIDLVLGTQPIFILPYCMAPLELKELKEQL